MRVDKLHLAGLVAAALLALLSVTLVMPAHGQSWQPIPLVTKSMLAAGYKGGEGAQVIRSLAISQSDPNFLLMGTDVGGIYRSFNAGRTWQVCMVGWHGRGCNCIAIDPKNSDHIIALGANGMDWNANWGESPTGIYLSRSKGAAWKLVYPSNDSNDARPSSLAFDPTSYDPTVGWCVTAYWLSRDSGLYKSVDGGQTWSQVSKEYSGGCLAVHPTRGFVYIGDSSNGSQGFYKSDNGGSTFAKCLDDQVSSINVIATQPNNIYIGVAGNVMVSNNSGETFAKISPVNALPTAAPVRALIVDPTDPQNMICNQGGAQWWESYTWYTIDGGRSWAQSVLVPANHFLPINGAGDRFAFDPIKLHVAFGTSGSGCILKSVDCGKDFAWSNDGENAVMNGSSFGFSSESNNTAFVSFQDFNAGATFDGGKTWTYLNPAGNGWGGYEYSGFTSNGKIMWTGDAPSWTGKRTLKVSKDAGRTWRTSKDAGGEDILFEGSDICYCDPTNDAVLFASNWRSSDNGDTWSRMNGCDGVFTSCPTGQRELFGRHGDGVCRSVDHGVTWTDVTSDLPSSINDVAYDQVHARLYVAANNELRYFQAGSWYSVDVPKDYKGNVHVRSVAVDPGNPDIVYVSGAADIYATDTSVCCSIDAAKNWINLTVTNPLKNSTVEGGPHEVSWIRVNPATHDLWAAGECFGLWKISVEAVKQYASTATKTAGNPTLVR